MLDTHLILDTGVHRGCKPSFFFLTLFVKLLGLMAELQLKKLMPKLYVAEKFFVKTVSWCFLLCQHINSFNPGSTVTHNSYIKQLFIPVRLHKQVAMTHVVRCG